MNYLSVLCQINMIVFVSGQATIIGQIAEEDKYSMELEFSILVPGYKNPNLYSAINSHYSQASLLYEVWLQIISYDDFRQIHVCLVEVSWQKNIERSPETFPTLSSPVLCCPRK